MNAKKSTRFIANFFFALLWVGFGACGGGEEIVSDEQPIIGQPSQSDCLAAMDGDGDTNESVELIVEGDRLQIIDHYAEFNCCLAAWMEVEIDGSRITVLEVEDPNDAGACDCICPYELGIDILNLAEGEYEVSVYRYANTPSNLIHEEFICIGDDCGSQPECEEAIECLEHNWLINCMGHWACEQGSCVETCEAETCGDGFCDAQGGENEQCCHDDCAVHAEPSLSSFSASCGECGIPECYEEGAPLGESTLSYELELGESGLYNLRATHVIACIDVAILDADLAVEGNTLVLIEDIDNENPVDCYCNQTASILVNDLTPGSWTLEIYNDDRSHLLIAEDFTVGQ